MKILIDDVYNVIEDEKGNRLLKVNNQYAFNEIINNVLTSVQFDKLHSSNTIPFFILSNKKEAVLKSYIKNGFPESSTWHGTEIIKK